MTAAPAPADAPLSRQDPMPAPRWELLQALGALSAVAHPASRPVSRALGLAEWTPADHTRLFVLELPPYASIHIGAEGKLGGDGTDRVAGLWRALGLVPPADVDHLACLLCLYAYLGHAADTCTTPSSRRRLAHATRTLLFEYLWSWLPGYLAAVAAIPAGAEWALLTLAALRSEVEAADRTGRLPACLRDAPPPIEATIGYDELLDALTAPLRSGFVLTHTDLADAGRDIGVGVRRGERRYALGSMLEQDPTATLLGLARHARRWESVHRAQHLGGPACSWWASRAGTTALALESLGASQGPRPPGPAGRGAGEQPLSPGQTTIRSEDTMQPDLDTPQDMS